VHQGIEKILFCNEKKGWGSVSFTELSGTLAAEDIFLT